MVVGRTGDDVLQVYNDAPSGRLIICANEPFVRANLQMVLESENILCTQLVTSCTDVDLKDFVLSSGVLIAHESFILGDIDLSACSSILFFDPPSSRQVKVQIMSAIDRPGQVHPIAIYET